MKFAKTCFALKKGAQSIRLLLFLLSIFTAQLVAFPQTDSTFVFYKKNNAVVELYPGSSGFHGRDSIGKPEYAVFVGLSLRTRYYFTNRLSAGAYFGYGRTFSNVYFNIPDLYQLGNYARYDWHVKWKVKLFAELLYSFSNACYVESDENYLVSDKPEFQTLDFSMGVNLPLPKPFRHFLVSYFYGVNYLVNKRDCNYYSGRRNLGVGVGIGLNYHFSLL
ncbi:MAG: hypothetical protein COA57_03350 [Flavobacteriales bacterium]|nr:MAG: hypothetical protein COA57_03350 [Flavobacteriales bacterium]